MSAGKFTNFAIGREAKKNINKPQGRLAVITLIPSCPVPPTNHPGCDSTIHKDKPLSSEYTTLLELAEKNILISSNNGEAVCHNVIFLACENDPDYPEKLYKPHLLSTYSKQLVSEKQKNFKFNIAAHGDNSKIGSTIIDSRIDMDMFTELLDRVLTDTATKMGDASFFKEPKNGDIEFVFHSCNSALANYQPKAGTVEITDAILKQSLIGKFFSCMRELGYEKFEVSGYRGYYASMKNGGGIRVQKYVDSTGADTTDGTYCKFTITSKGQVIIPTKPHFEVTLLPNMVFSEHKQHTVFSNLDKRIDDEIKDISTDTTVISKIETNKIGELTKPLKTNKTQYFPKTENIEATWVEKIAPREENTLKTLIGVSV